MNVVGVVALACALALLTSCGGGLCSGDLLFVVAPQGNAITSVTHGADGLPIDHVAICDGERVLEAVPGFGVRHTPRDSFLLRHRDEQGRSLVRVGRVRHGLDLQQTLQRARQYVGLPYDSLYSPSDAAIYCSELVQKSYVDRQGRSLFPEIPMEFRDSTGRIPQHFVDFYHSRGLPVPEGKPGTNPGQLSRDVRVKVWRWGDGEMGR